MPYALSSGNEGLVCMCYTWNSSGYYSQTIIYIELGYQAPCVTYSKITKYNILLAI